MTRREKLVAQVLEGRADANIDFDDLRGLLLSFGFDERTKGSHHLFRKSGIENGSTCSTMDEMPGLTKSNKSGQ